MAFLFSPSSSLCRTSHLVRQTSLTAVLFVLSTLSVHAAGAHSNEEANSESYGDIFANVDEQTKVKGKAVYDGVCGQCHNAGLNRAPQFYLLNYMTPESILRAMTDGVMKDNAAHLAYEDKVAVAEYLSSRKLGSSAEVSPTLMCTGEAAAFDRNEPPRVMNWGLDPNNAHFVSSDLAGIDRSNVGSLKLKWSLAFPNAVRARSQPTFAAGAAFVGSHDGTVYALDRETGCARWTFSASAEVRNGIVIQDWTAGDTDADPLLFFGDLIGHQYAVHALTGRLAWKKKMEDHHATTLTGATTVIGDKIYVPVSSLEEGSATDAAYDCCTFRGSLVAMKAADGAEIWRTYFTEKPTKQGVTDAGATRFGPSGVPVWSTPAVDRKRNQFYVTTGDNYSSPATGTSDSIIAVDIDTGNINWVFQAREDDAWNASCDRLATSNCPEEDGPDHDYGAGAVLVKTNKGNEVVVAGDKAGLAVGVDPDTGKLLWKNKVGRGGVVAGIHFGIAATNGHAIIPVSDVPDGREYDEPARPGIYALDADTGEFIWKAPSRQDICNGRAACHPGYQAAVTVTPELIFAGSNDGYVRVYDAANGKVLWERDTAVEVETVNGDKASGGSIGGGAAPVVIDGLLFVNSGYGFAGKMPGNAMLVYEVTR